MDKEQQDKVLEQPDAALKSTVDAVVAERPASATIVSKKSAEANDGDDAKAKADADAVKERPIVGASQNPEDAEHGDDSRLRGDAIGNTLYSERFVLTTLLKLTDIDKELAKDEKFENDLCSLWDMTIEEDVIKLLLQHNVFDLFVQCIELSNDKRLVEILVGIMANMCNCVEARVKLCEETAVVAFLLELTGCADSLTLLQLMRLLSVVIIHADRQTATQWYKHISAYAKFVVNISYILSNSVNEALLRQTIETLNAILAKFALIEPEQLQLESDSGTARTLPNFEELFVTESLIAASTEAFIALLDDDDDTAALSSKTNQNFMQIFLNIHCILTQYDELSLECYSPNIAAIMQCICIILQPLCEIVNMSELCSREQDLLEGINDILLALKDPFNDRCLRKMLQIWNIFRLEKEKRAHKSPIPIGFEEDELKHDVFNLDSNCSSLLYSIVRMINCASDTQLVGIIESCVADDIENLINILSCDKQEQIMKESHTRILNAVKNFEESKK